MLNMNKIDYDLELEEIVKEALEVFDEQEYDEELVAILSNVKEREEWYD